jgi:hypothetical protein
VWVHGVRGKEGGAYTAPALFLGSIHRTSAKGYSANFALTEF